MSGSNELDRDLKDKARKQMASVAIAGSTIETKPGFDPDELADAE